MIQYKTHVGHTIQIPSKTIIDYAHTGGKDFSTRHVEIIDLANCDIINGDGHVSYRCAELIDLLSKQRSIASDVIFHCQQKRNTAVYQMSVAENEAKKIKSAAFVRISAQGWAHKTKAGEEVKASSGVLEKIVDGDDEVVAAQNKLAEMQKDIDILYAKIQSLERFYFNVDASIKMIAKMLNYGF